MAAARKTLYIDQGATFRYQGTWSGMSDRAGHTYQPYDLSNCYLLMEIRRAPGAPPYLTLTTAEPAYAPQSSVILLDETGSFEIYITWQDTDTFNFLSAYYDLVCVFPDNEVYRVMEGKIRIRPRVTNVDEILSALSENL